MIFNETLYIIHADDSADDLDIFRAAVESIAPNVVLRSLVNGEYLMNLLTDEQHAIPNIIFLDLSMPVQEGGQCLIEIRTNERLKSIPIVIHSASTNPKDIQKCFDECASLYFNKPINFADLKRGLFEIFSYDNVLQPSEFDDFVFNLY